MKIFVGSDHAAFEAKREILAFLSAKPGFEVVDEGCFSSERASYAEFASKVALRVQSGDGIGILLCGSGIGVSMVANRYQNVRAALCRTSEEAKLSREHNDSNVLCVGARITALETIKQIVSTWLNTPFEGGRHVERIASFNTLGQEGQYNSESLTSPERWILGAVLSVVLYGAILGQYNRTYYESIYALEDGWLEYGTVWGLGLSLALCVNRAKQLWKVRPWTFKLGLLILAGLCIFGMGEEISWGQRIFGTASPTFFAVHNSQGETNLHNLVLNGVKLNKLIFGTLLSISIVFYFLFLPLLYRRRTWIRKWVDAFGVPMAKKWHLAAYIAVFLLAQASGSIKKGEMLEFAGVWIFFCMYFFPANLGIFKR